MPSSGGDQQQHQDNRGRLVVVALGGNALQRSNEPLTMEAQAKNARIAARAVACLTQAGYKLCVTHGNGPQVGMLAELDPHTPLDVLDAESQGQLGYLLDMELGNELGLQQQLVSLLTRVVVDPKDEAFKEPTKPIGPFYDKEQADKLAREKGWTFKEKDNGKWRRVVPSPTPVEILEAQAILLLQHNDIMTICCGGGGIPVAYEDVDWQQSQGQQGRQQQEQQQQEQQPGQQQQGQRQQGQDASSRDDNAAARDQDKDRSSSASSGDGKGKGTAAAVPASAKLASVVGSGGDPHAASGRRLRGVEAVIDKDAASSLLGRQVGARALLMLTDVPAVWDPDSGAAHTPLPLPIKASDVANKEFAAGSMAPKIQAAVCFVRATGGVAGIGALEDALDILQGKAGTLIVADD